MASKGRKQTQVKVAAPAAVSVRGEIVPSPQYRPDAVDYICLRVLEGDRLDTIAKDADMPTKATILKWLNNDPGFMQRYLDCLKISALGDAEKMQAIADGESTISVEKTTKNSEGEDITTILEMPEDVQRSALRVKTLQWRLARLLPKVFGDKVQNEHTLTGDLAKLLKGVDNAGHTLPGS